LKIVTEIEIKVVDDIFCDWDCNMLNGANDCWLTPDKELSAKINPNNEQYMMLRSKKCLTAKVSAKQ
jgi:hypothetical protein